MRTVVFHRDLAADHAIDVVVVHEVLVVGIVAEDCIQSVAHALCRGRSGRLFLFELDFLVAEELRAFAGDLPGRHGGAAGIGEFQRDGVGRLWNKTEHGELMGGGVVLALVGGCGEIRVPFGVHGVGDAGGLACGEVHVHRCGVGAVGVDCGERIVQCGGGLVSVRDERGVGVLLVCGGVDVGDCGV